MVLSRPDLEGRISRYRALIEEELNVREMELYRGGETHVLYVVKPNFRRLGPRLGKKMQLLKKALAEARGGHRLPGSPRPGLAEGRSLAGLGH